MVTQRVDMGEPDTIAAPARALARPSRLASAIAVGFVLLVLAVLILLFRANEARDAAEQAERRSYNILVASEQLDGAIAHAEASLNAFVITGDKATGTRYFDQWIKAERLLYRLDALTRDNERERQIIAKLREKFVERSRELARPASLATYDRKWSAYNAVADDAERPTARQIRSLLSQLGAEERDRLAERRDHAQKSTSWANMLDALMAAFGVLLLIAAGVISWAAIRAVAARTDSERRATFDRRRARQLEEAVNARTAELVEANARIRAEAEERTFAEAQLAQMQKMEAVGQLSGGIAHDFNNMLAVVVGGLDLALRKLRNGGDNVTHYIEQALEGATRASALTQRLLAFSRQQPLTPEGVEVNDLIENMIEMLDRSLDERITVRTGLAGTLWPVFVDPSQLENAILNLAVNSRDAMSEGGLLTIETRNLCLDEPAAVSHGELQAGDYVMIRVSDTGAGMTADVLTRVFEPFFTTKELGKGTGLGLSQVFGFLKQSNGGIDIESTPDIGTVVTLYLPRHEAAQIVADTPAAEDTTPVTAPEDGHVLVVEDEPRVRVSTVNALRHLGYRVTEAQDGHEALLMLAADPDIGLVLTDVIMPGMNGPQLAEHLRQDYPQIGILFTTGYAGETGADLVPGIAILHKPFTISKLEAAVSQAYPKNRRQPEPQRAGALG